MSQAGHLSVAANPAVATSFTTDTGTAVPAANILDVRAVDVQANNDNGIQTRGGVSTVAGGLNDLEIQLTNRIQGGLTTVGAGTSDLTLISFDAAPFSGTAGVYVFDFRVAAFESATPSGGVYTLSGGLRTNGTTPVIIGADFDKIVHEDAALATADVNILVSGNNLIVRFTGVAALTIAWDIVGTYTRSV